MGPAFAAKFAEIVIPELIPRCRELGMRLAHGEIEYGAAFDQVWEYAASRGAYHLPVDLDAGIDEIADLEVWISDEILTAMLETEPRPQLPPPDPFMQQIGRAVAKGYLSRAHAQMAVLRHYFWDGATDREIATNLQAVSQNG